MLTRHFLCVAQSDPVTDARAWHAAAAANQARPPVSPDDGSDTYSWNALAILARLSGRDRHRLPEGRWRCGALHRPGSPCDLAFDTHPVTVHPDFPRACSWPPATRTRASSTEFRSRKAVSGMGRSFKPAFFCRLISRGDPLLAHFAVRVRRYAPSIWPGQGSLLAASSCRSRPAAPWCRSCNPDACRPAPGSARASSRTAGPAA